MKFTSHVALGLLALGSLLLGSCSESIDGVEQRRYNNEQAFKSFATNTSYKAVTSPGYYGQSAIVYMQWLEEGTGATPKATDYIRMNYSGHLLTTWVQDGSGFFDGDTSASPKAKTRVSGYIPGMRIALENMRVGDRVNVIIPWYLAYGATGLGTVIPSYSALHFEVKLHSIAGDYSDE